jgi:putative membrane protein
MLLSWIFAALHLLGLGLGLGAIWVRSLGLRGTLDANGLRRVFYADTLWAVAAGLWIVTGLVRAFGGLEKGSDYYLGNSIFWLKMALLGLILLLEIWPMVTLIRWRIQLSRSQTINTQSAAGFALISVAQAVLVVAMVFAATAMARGLGD